MCDMDRLGRNEFIGEVRVALKKLKDGESKKYYMGLERIAQVCACACACACACVCVCLRACVRACESHCGCCEVTSIGICTMHNLVFGYLLYY